MTGKIRVTGQENFAVEDGGKFSGRMWPLVESEEDWDDAMMQECC
jgi:hypothetical protein